MKPLLVSNCLSLPVWDDWHEPPHPVVTSTYKVPFSEKKKKVHGVLGDKLMWASNTCFQESITFEARRRLEHQDYKWWETPQSISCGSFFLWQRQGFWERIESWGSRIFTVSLRAMQPASHTGWVRVQITHTCGITFIRREHMVRRTELAAPDVARCGHLGNSLASHFDK